MIGGIIMDAKQVKKFAMEQGISGFFKTLYKNNMEILKKLSEEEVTSLFSTDGNDDILFTNIWISKKSSESVGEFLVSSDTSYVESDDEEYYLERSIQNSISVKFEDFDTKGFTMQINLKPGEDRIEFENFIDSEKPWLKKLTAEFLNEIFGKYISEVNVQDNYIFFTVDEEFFK